MQILPKMKEIFLRSRSIPLAAVYGKNNSSSSFDLAYRGQLEIQPLASTRIKGSIERVGANYHTLGAPMLMNDVFRWKAEVKQSLFKRQISISAYARQDDNGLSAPFSSIQSNLQSFGINVQTNFRKLPSIAFSYAPYAQNTQLSGQQDEYQTNSTMLNIMAAYPYKVGNDINMHSQLSFQKQFMNSTIPGIDYDLTIYSLSQSVNYKRSGLNVAVSYTPNQVIGDINTTLL
jgi:hypothetical protein